VVDFRRHNQRILEAHLVGSGIADRRVLDALQSVAREDFVPPELAEFAYENTSLPIGDGQAISAPYVVALKVEALRLRGGERVLDVGTGSGYLAAVLSRLAGEVYTIERIPALAAATEQRLARLGYANVCASCGDGTSGWAEHAPYDAIAVAAGGPKAPPSLLAQLTIGGRLVMPIGPDESRQKLVRITRVTRTEYRKEALADVRFAPLVGAEGWSAEDAEALQAPRRPRTVKGLAALVREAAEPFDDISTAPLDGLLERIGDARVVLLGEATQGTSEFYRMRARITRELVTRRGFHFVAVEADWPDAARVDDYVIGRKRRSSHDREPFSEFPTWLWQNEEASDFVDWLRAYNADQEHKVGFHGLDLYSLFSSTAAVLAYLDRVDPGAARVARHRYGALTPWQRDPAAYGEAVLVGGYATSEHAVVAMLEEMLRRRMELASNGEGVFDPAQNAHVVANARRYYRAMYYGAATSWNLRDTHLFDTLESLLAFHGPGSKGVVWTHNAHAGDARATEMRLRGELNLGQLCRASLGREAFLVGLGTDHGTVAAASSWDGPMKRMDLRSAHPESYEHAFHHCGVRALTLHFREPAHRALRDELAQPRLERAIGIVYQPEAELASHYFASRLAQEFDAYVWFDETGAVRPLGGAAGPRRRAELPHSFPFGL
jgi:protein-L-isoaspartate(D-aspartate) O-methyltransferase